VLNISGAMGIIFLALCSLHSTNIHCSDARFRASDNESLTENVI
jgi:hypothetical protein